MIGTFISDVVLQLLSFIAENERESIRRRQAEGIAAAKLRGVIFGNQTRPLPDNFGEPYDKWKAKELNFDEFTRECNMASSTLFKKAKEYKDKLRKKELNH